MSSPREKISRVRGSGRGHHGKRRPTRAGRQIGVCHAGQAGDWTFSPSAASPNPITPDAFWREQPSITLECFRLPSSFGPGFKAPQRCSSQVRQVSHQDPGEKAPGTYVLTPVRNEKHARRKNPPKNRKDFHRGQ